MKCPEYIIKMDIIRYCNRVTLVVVACMCSWKSEVIDNVRNPIVKMSIKRINGWNWDWFEVVECTRWDWTWI